MGMTPAATAILEAPLAKLGARFELSATLSHVRCSSLLSVLDFAKLTPS